MTHPNSTANRDLSDYLDLALRLANLFPALLDFETGEIGPDLASCLVPCWGIPGCSSETESDADKMSGPMAKRNTGKMEPETK